LHEETGRRGVDGACACAVGFGLAERVVAAGVFDGVVEVGADVVAQCSLVLPQGYRNASLIHRTGSVDCMAVVAGPLTEHLQLEQTRDDWGGELE